MKGFRELLGLVLLASFILVSCARQSPPALTTLKYVILGDEHGLGASWSISALHGCQDYFKYVEEAGLLKGVKVVADLVDTGSQFERDIVAYEELARDESVLALTAGFSSSLEELKIRLASDEIVAFSAEPTKDMMYPAGYIYALAPLYEEQTYALLEWLKEHDWKETRPARVGIICSDTSYGRANARGVELGAEKNGWSVVSQKFISLSQLDYTAELVELREAGTDYVFNGLDATSSIRLLQSMAYLRLIGEIRLITNYWNVTEEVLDAAGASTEGVIACTPWSLWDDPESESVRLARETYELYHEDKRPPYTPAYISSWVTGMVIVKATEIALQSTSPNEIDRRLFKKSLDEIKDPRPTQIIGPIDIIAERPWITRSIKVIEIAEGQRTPASQFLPTPRLFE